MESLAGQLDLPGRICLLCIGNTDGGDDALGVRLGEALIAAGASNVILAGSEPEKPILNGSLYGYDHVIFVDAVDVGAEAGSVVFLNAQEMTSRFAQVSTHRLSLGLLARWVAASGKTQAWLLGVQPQSLARDGKLSNAVQSTLSVLQELLEQRFLGGVAVC